MMIVSSANNQVITRFKPDTFCVKAWLSTLQAMFQQQQTYSTENSAL